MPLTGLISGDAANILFYLISEAPVKNRMHYPAGASAVQKLNDRAVYVDNKCAVAT